MRILAILAILATKTLMADPGIMIDVDIIIHGPTGSGEVEMGLCK